MFEVQMLAIQNPAAYAHYLKGTSSSWLALIEAALPPSVDRRARATLCAAVIDGLLLEFLSTGDLRRTSSCIGYFRFHGCEPVCGARIRAARWLVTSTQRASAP
jgi:hypothetical protein